jgi:primary-amine oxidase
MMQQKEASSAAHSGSAYRHPLDPLSEVELAAACDILKTDKQLGSDARFGFVQLEEPAKAGVLA